MYKFKGYTFSHYEDGMAVYYKDKHKFVWDYDIGGFMELYGNRSFYAPEYPRTAYKEYVENYGYIDANYKNYYVRDIEDSNELYYGYKECQKLGRSYNAPDPRVSSKLPWLRPYKILSPSKSP